MNTTINLCLNDFISRHCPSLLKINPNIVKHGILHSYWPLNKGKNNRKKLIGTAERWPRPLNRGGRLEGILFTVLY